LRNLEVVRTDYELPDDERVCPACSGHLHEIGIDIRREIIYNPASYHVSELASHVYSLKALPGTDR
jgi:transposase